MSPILSKSFAFESIFRSRWIILNPWYWVLHQNVELLSGLSYKIMECIIFILSRGEEAFSGEAHGNSYSPEWSPEDETAEEEEDGEEERLLRPRFEDEEVCLSDAETLGSNGSDEFTDYENSGIVEQQRNGVGGEEERQCWVCFASEEDDPVAAWVHPCLCKGTTKWVHQV